MRLAFEAVVSLVIVASTGAFQAAAPNYTIEEAVALAQTQNPDIAVARQRLKAARGGLIEARSGYLPSVVSTGLLRERQHQTDSRLRDEDYNASLRVVQNLYTGGAVSSQVAMAKLSLEKQDLELKAVSDRVAMDVRVVFNQPTAPTSRWSPKLSSWRPARRPKVLFSGSPTSM